jgi:Family of unknown function (DUF6166)
MVFSGKFTNKEWFEVWKDGKPFSAVKSLKIRNHSPDGFSFGYCGSGCAQLALGILLEVTDQETAENLYQDYKNSVISMLPKEEGSTWKLTSEQVLEWLSKR